MKTMDLASIAQPDSTSSIVLAFRILPATSDSTFLWEVVWIFKENALSLPEILEDVLNADLGSSCPMVSAAFRRA